MAEVTFLEDGHKIVRQPHSKLTNCIAIGLPDVAMPLACCAAAYHLPDLAANWAPSQQQVTSSLQQHGHALLILAFWDGR